MDTDKEIREHSLVFNNMPCKRALNLFFTSSGEVHSHVIKLGARFVLQLMAQHVGLREGTVKHVGVDCDIHEVLWVADTVVYGSICEELSFPPILIRAMSLKRPIVVPNIRAISQEVSSVLDD